MSSIQHNSLYQGERLSRELLPQPPPHSQKAMVRVWEKGLLVTQGTGFPFFYAQHIACFGHHWFQKVIANFDILSKPQSFLPFCTFYDLIHHLTNIFKNTSTMKVKQITTYHSMRRYSRQNDNFFYYWLTGGTCMFRKVRAGGLLFSHWMSPCKGLYPSAGSPQVSALLWVPLNALRNFSTTFILMHVCTLAAPRCPY